MMVSFLKEVEKGIKGHCYNISKKSFEFAEN